MIGATHSWVIIGRNMTKQQVEHYMKPEDNLVFMSTDSQTQASHCNIRTDCAHIGVDGSFKTEPTKVISFSV